MRWLVPTTWLLGLLPAAAGPMPSASGDQQQVQGAWVCVSMERDGKPIAPERYQNSRLIIEGENFTFEQGGRVVLRGIRRLDPTQTPKAVDDTHTQGPFKGKTYRGIYELAGDRFRTCNGSAGQARPKEFATRPGSGLLLVEYRREVPRDAGRPGGRQARERNP